MTIDEEWKALYVLMELSGAVNAVDKLDGFGDRILYLLNKEGIIGDVGACLKRVEGKKVNIIHSGPDPTEQYEYRTVIGSFKNNDMYKIDTTKMVK